MLRITGGKVYDPANGIDGVVKDVCIADGRVVSNVDGGRTIDARGTLVFPGGVDVHTHVAGGALNFARGLVPENQRIARKFLHDGELRAGIGGLTPTTFATGYLYAGMGWTTVNEAAVPVLSAKLTLVDHMGTRILPARYTDNYLTILPGEPRRVLISYPARFGTRASVKLRGWNVRPAAIKVRN